MPFPKTPLSLLLPSTAAFVSLSLGSPCADKSTDPALVLFDYPELETIRGEIRSGAKAVQPAWRRLLATTEPLLQTEPLSVLDKKSTAASGDKHDYFSIGNYTWPNPATPDGMPYIRRDGFRNPEAQEATYDKKNFNLTVLRVNLLALAWFHSRDERYAAKAAGLLRVWFINPATRMNPNLNYAVSQPGVHDGHYIGIIETASLTELVDHVRLLALSKSWTAADNENLKHWFFNYTTWLLESDFGKKEEAAKNNHSTWHAAQVAVYSLYTGHPDRVRRALAVARENIGKQIAGDGSLPLEMGRNRSFLYSIYGLRAFAVVADCAALAGDDLWNYRSPEGRGLRMAFDFLAPWLAGEKAWAGEDVAPDGERTAMRTHALVMLRQSWRAWRIPAMGEATRRLAASLPQEDRRVALLGLNPLPAQE
ncbi:MAG: alginate lyase family protein [Opitutaceae bacterium]|jgi:hypothetical protein|nr:alginate lyase family protein [Opitutaceae bacterium]